jgi:YbbR domain-containing protein
MLFLMALVAAYLLWYGLAGQRREETAMRGYKAPLTLVNLPNDLVITSSVPETVAIQIRGPLSGVDTTSQPLEVLLDLSEARPGLHDFDISEDEIVHPSAVSIVSVEPATITLQLERLETAILPVQPLIEGAPAPGFVLGDTRVAPPQLAVQGPGSLLGALEEVETTVVSVEGATSAVEATVQPRLPHPLLRSVTAVPLLVVVEIDPAPTPTPTPEPRRRR